MRWAHGSASIVPSASGWDCWVISKVFTFRIIVLVFQKKGLDLGKEQEKLGASHGIFAK